MFSDGPEPVDALVKLNRIEINGRQVECKRAVPKGKMDSGRSNDHSNGYRSSGYPSSASGYRRPSGYMSSNNYGPRGYMYMSKMQRKPEHSSYTTTNVRGDYTTSDYGYGGRFAGPAYFSEQKHPAQRQMSSEWSSTFTAAADPLYPSSSADGHGYMHGYSGSHVGRTSYGTGYGGNLCSRFLMADFSLLNFQVIMISKQGTVSHHLEIDRAVLTPSDGKAVLIIHTNERNVLREMSSLPLRYKGITINSLQHSRPLRPRTA